MLTTHALLHYIVHSTQCTVHSTHIMILYTSWFIKQAVLHYTVHRTQYTVHKAGCTRVKRAHIIAAMSLCFLDWTGNALLALLAAGRVSRTFTLHYISLHCMMHLCTELCCTELHCTALHCTALHCTILDYISFNCIALHFYCCVVPSPWQWSNSNGAYHLYKQFTELLHCKLYCCNSLYAGQHLCNIHSTGVMRCSLDSSIAIYTVLLQCTAHWTAALQFTLYCCNTLYTGQHQ